MSELKIYDRIEDVIEVIEATNLMSSEAERAPVLANTCLRPKGYSFDTIDPFSPTYRREILALYSELSGRIYQPAECEKSPYLEPENWTVPNIYNAGNTAVLGDTMIAMGQVLRVLDAEPGARILEYGVGEGTISLDAARSGCDVTVVDIESRYLDIVRKRAEMHGVNVRTVLAPFGPVCPGEKFDRILFYEAFHHALDHAELLVTLSQMLNPGGFIVFAGEPIIETGGYWECAVPFPWTLRMDAMSIRAIRAYGWLELGFKLPYFTEAVNRAGMELTIRRCAETARGDCFIARC